MTNRLLLRTGALVLCGLVLAGCGNPFGGTQRAGDRPFPDAAAGSHLSGQNEAAVDARSVQASNQSSVWDTFGNRADPNVQIAVNKYLWTAALEVLNFLPVQQVDPFSGVIVTGYGTPPGGGRAYRATVQVTDPALDARSLKVALESRGGAVSPETVRAVEDAILTRARQLRTRDSRF